MESSYHQVDEPSRQEQCPAGAERWASLLGERKERVGELVDTLIRGLAYQLRCILFQTGI